MQLLCSIYWLTQQLPKMCTLIFRSLYGKVACFAVYICGNCWVTQYINISKLIFFAKSHISLLHLFFTLISKFDLCKKLASWSIKRVIQTRLSMSNCPSPSPIYPCGVKLGFTPVPLTIMKKKTHQAAKDQNAK